VRQGAGEECPRSTGIAALRDEDVDDLPVLIDRAVEVGPAAGDLDVGLIDKPAVTRGMASRASGVDELGREGLCPALEAISQRNSARFGFSR
jgi:hypothetical protein